LFTTRQYRVQYRVTIEERFVLASVRSAVLEGVNGRAVTVEVHVSRGLPGYTVVGLPDTAGRESRERVRAALLSSALEYPKTRVTVNLAPASVRKTGAGLELAIAIALVCANGALPAGALDNAAVLGELGLDGRVRGVPGMLALVDELAKCGVEDVIVPVDNAAEAALVPNVTVHVARTLAELHACLKGEAPWPDAPDDTALGARCDDLADEPLDLADVRGLDLARRALTVAAAGAHHVLFVGPPGVGKTMLARRLPTIMPDLERREALEVTRVHSAAGTLHGEVLKRHPPFRSPHHSASAVALVGGGSPRVRPGEISLAHRGALFLDEIPEFPASVLECLRQPLEERVVRVSRASGTIEFPADFLLIACANPCPCGRGRDSCRCSDVQRARYGRRLSAPLLDRFDLRLMVQPPKDDADDQPGECSADVRARVEHAVARQLARLADTPWRRNAHLPPGALEHYAALSDPVRRAWTALCRDRRLTNRGAARVRRVARTLADLDDRADISDRDVQRAGWMREELREMW
jgi:magnesium chelatase family protein